VHHQAIVRLLGLGLLRRRQDGFSGTTFVRSLSLHFTSPPTYKNTPTGKLSFSQAITLVVWTYF
jgi:hypothetical protein